MKTTSHVKIHSVETSTRCLVAWTDPTTKDEEDFIEIKIFEIPQQQHASGLGGSIAIGPDRSIPFVWDPAQSDPKIILDNINRFFVDQEEWTSLRKKWIYTVLFDEVNVSAEIEYSIDGIKSTATLHQNTITRYSHPLFHHNRGNVKKWYITKKSLFIAIKKQINITNYSKLWDENRLIELV